MNKQKKNIVIGLGETGLSAVTFLRQQGLDVLVMDQNECPANLAKFKQTFPDVPYILGRLDEAILLQVERVILSPGVPRSTPEIVNCIAAGVSVVSDIQLFTEHTKMPIVAITGSNGKSTVTSLLAHMVVSSGLEVGVGGNLGPPALSLLQRVPDWYVLELSSFQLASTEHLNAFASVILNISPDHLDHHRDMQDYIQAKLRIYQGTEHVVVNRDETMVIPEKSGPTFGLSEPEAGQWGIRLYHGKEYLACGDELYLLTNELPLVGRYQVSNTLCALALGTVMGLPKEGMITGILSFKGLPHRCCFVQKVNGVSWYNDSKATNIGAAEGAIKGLADRYSGQLIWLAGGQGKGADFSLMREVVTQHVKVAILFGQDGPQMAEALAECAEIFEVKDMVSAIDLAKQLTKSGDAVLLAPACASFDQFKSYAHRGKIFEEFLTKIS